MIGQIQLLVELGFPSGVTVPSDCDGGGGGGYGAPLVVSANAPLTDPTVQGGQVIS